MKSSPDVSPKDVTAATPCRSIAEYTAKKTDLMIAMIRRAIRKGVRFLMCWQGSWFASKDVIRFPLPPRQVRLPHDQGGRKQQDKILSGREALYRLQAKATRKYGNTQKTCGFSACGDVRKRERMCLFMSS